MNIMSSTVTKPWGREIIITNQNLPYTGKIFEIKKEARWSLQYHDQKTETISLLAGKARLSLGSSADNLTEIDMVQYEGYTITPGQIHRVKAESDCLLMEVSVPETGTTYRLQDDYHRPDETPEIRNSPNRGWGTK